MSLTWTPEMKQIAKDKQKALVKLQIQLKHATGGDFKIVGPMSPERGMALFLVGMLKDGDPKIGKILAMLGKAMLPLPACLNPSAKHCGREDDYCREIGHCVFDKCEHDRFYNSVCVPCNRSSEDG